MFWDCHRCGYGFRYTGSPRPPCVCEGMTDTQAAYLKSLHAKLAELRQIARKLNKVLPT